MKRWDEFRFLPGALEALARLTRAGARLFVVTNQATINRGITPRAVVDEINQRMIGEIARHGGVIEAVVFCPHTPEEGCECRKPRPGLLRQVARARGIDLTAAYMVGDALSDIEAGQAAGCHPVLVLTGRGRAQYARALAAGRNGFHVEMDLAAAAAYILAREQAATRPRPA